MIHKTLIIEDNKAHMKALCKIVKELQRDIEIYCAYNTEQAYQLILEQHIHLFIIDIILNKKAWRCIRVRFCKRNKRNF